MPEWLFVPVGILGVIALIAVILFGVWTLDNWANRPMREAQQACIEHGYIEALYYETQARWFCVGTNGETWQFVPVEQLQDGG